MLQQLKIREKSAPQGQPAFCTSHPGPCPPQARRAAASRWQFSWAVGIHPWVSRGLGPGLFCPRIWLHSSATLIWPRHKIPPVERKIQRKPGIWALSWQHTQAEELSECCETFIPPCRHKIAPNMSFDSLLPTPLTQPLQNNGKKPTCFRISEFIPELEKSIYEVKQSSQNLSWISCW